MELYPNDEIARLLSLFSRLARADWKKVTQWGIKTSEVRLLLAVKADHDRGGAPNLTVSDISKTLRVTSPTVTQMINSLVKDGLLLRTPNTEDRRISEITLTELGMDVAHKVMKDVRALFSGLIEHLGREKSDQLAELLTEAFDYLRSEHEKRKHE